MKRKSLKHSALYLLTSANIIYGIKNGFDWLTYFAVFLTSVVFIMNIAAMIKNNNKSKEKKNDD